MLHFQFITGIENCISSVNFRYKLRNRGCYSSDTYNGTELRIDYDCRPCTSPPELAAKTIDELTADDLCNGGEFVVHFAIFQTTCKIENKKLTRAVGRPPSEPN